MPLQEGTLGQTLPHEHERNKYAELFSLIYARTGTSTLKESFKAIKSVIDECQQSNSQELVLLLQFYLRASLEATSMIKKLLSTKLDFSDDKIGVLWGVYSREPTLNVIDGVLKICTENSLADQNVSNKLHNMTWKLISKLAKVQLIHREHLVNYFPVAVQQLNQLFGVASSERLPTIISFLSTLTKLRSEDLPLPDKISIVELVLSKVREQMSSAAG